MVAVDRGEISFISTVNKTCLFVNNTGYVSVPYRVPPVREELPVQPVPSA